MRKWLWKALDEVVNKEVYSNLYLRNHLHEVSERDRALATRIFMEPFKIIVIAEHAGLNL